LIPLKALPSLNAALNGFSALLLTAGYFFIRRRNILAHRACMLGAFLSSVLFLTSYLYYHAQVGSVRYQGQGWMRTLYFLILISHTTLAVCVVPMALRTLFLASKERFSEHAWWARRTLPLWLYVSVTGVVIYVLLYRA
jgi:uncharacterized membrane protein YozB (DUF420 family)